MFKLNNVALQRIVGDKAAIMLLAFGRGAKVRGNGLKKQNFLGKNIYTRVGQ